MGGKKALAAEWAAEDAGMDWAPGMGSSDEEEAEEGARQ
jgi:hypothetical protein